MNRGISEWLCVIRLKDDAKFKGKLSRELKNDIRNLVHFHVNSRKSENLGFAGLYLPKAYKDLDEKLKKSYNSWHWNMMQSLKKKLTFGSKKDMRNVMNFNASSCKFENLHFDVLLLWIASNVLAKKLQKNDLSLHWPVNQTLKKNWLFVKKMT